MSPGGSADRQRQLVRQLVTDRLEQRPGWSTKFLKLECEIYGIYQNVTGTTVDQLVEEGEVDEIYHQIDNNPHPFIVRQGVDSVQQEPIYERTCEMHEFLSKSGNFANLTAYVALCKIFDELVDYIDIEVLPEGKRFHLLYNAGERVPDAFIRLPRENVPVEVYNGADYLSKRSNKFGQVSDFSSSEDDVVNNNPLLINRRSDTDFREAIRQMNGTVIDTGCIVTTERLYSEYKDAIDLFNLDELIYDLPPLEVANGTALNGEEYAELGFDSDGAQALRPPTEMIADVDELPDEYLQRIRGGVQLQYVNSIYRRTSDPNRQDACYVLQTIYNQLLRDGGRERDVAIRNGWQGAQEQYRRIAALEQRDDSQKEIVLDETGDLLTKLRDEHIVTLRNGKLHARKSMHPQPSLSF